MVGAARDDERQRLRAGNQIAVLPDGTLVDIQAVLFRGSGIQPTSNAVYMAAMRSTDGGRHWTSPSTIAPLGTVAVAADGKPLRVGDYLPDLAVDPASGTLYATRADGLGTSTNKIVLSRSTDGGRSWSAPQLLTSFDFANAPVARGHFVGDYQGLAAIGDADLIAFFGVAGDTEASANVVSVRLSR